MIVYALVVLVAAVAVQVTGAAPAAKQPSTFAVQAFRWGITGQYGRIWARLHPRYRAVTTRQFWETCKRRQAAALSSVEWLSVRAVEQHPARIRRPLLGTVKVTAVTLRVRYRSGGTVGSEADTVYFRFENGRWWGLWDTESYRAYRAGRCPA